MGSGMVFGMDLVMGFGVDLVIGLGMCLDVGVEVWSLRCRLWYGIWCNFGLDLMWV